MVAPFVDTANYYGKTDRRLIVSGGMDTTGVDNYREGVNLRTTSDIFQSNQIKLSITDGSQEMGSLPNGTLTHESTFQTFGQAPAVPSTTPFVDSGLSINTVVYLLTNPSEKSASVYYVNNGPVFRSEAVIADVGISPLPTSLEIDGVSQTTFRTPPGSNLRPFLEVGAWTLFLPGGGTTKPSRGLSVSNRIYSPTVPWRDSAPGGFIVEATNTQDLLGVAVTGSNGIVEPLFARKYAFGDSELQTSDMKSFGGGAVAYYGGNAVLYGTDSVAFAGTFKGS